MNIRDKLSFQFSLIVVTILIIFTTGIYYFTSVYRTSEYYTRLEDRANTTARLLLDVKEVGEELLKLIDKNTVALFEEKLFIFDSNNELIYFSPQNIDVQIDPPLIKTVRQKKTLKYKEGNREALGTVYNYNNQEYIVFISAHDKYGYSKMNNLKLVLIFEFIIGLIITIIAGMFYAGRALAPISRVISQVQNITGTNLNQRVDEGNKKDEIAQLAITFNQMLQRIEDAFVLQRDFVSNAAHELRTPFTILLAEIDFALMQERDGEYYKKVLIAQSEEIKKLSKLSNGLLDLARMSFDKYTFNLKNIRIDELLIETCNLVIKSNSNFKVHLNFDQLPENEDQLNIWGNEHLLTIAFKNLIENACKFSDDKSVNIELCSENEQLSVRFSDHGIGIHEEDIEMIFQPFYRGKNTHFIAGYGIGLALTLKIIHLHHADIRVNSILGKGSTFTISFPDKA